MTFPASTKECNEAIDRRCEQLERVGLHPGGWLTSRTKALPLRTLCWESSRMSDLFILHCADLHIDSPMRGLEADLEAPASRLRSATREAFVGLVDFAIREHIRLLLIAGDLYDGDWQDFSTGLFLVRELRRLTNAGIRVIAISGNHDAESVITRRLSWPEAEGAKLLSSRKVDTVRLDDLGVAVHGRSFPNRAVPENLAVEYPSPIPGLLNIGLLHTSADGRAGHASYAPCTAEQLAAHGYDYWALGHIHAREVLRADPWVVFPGNLQGRHVRETGSKGATLIKVTDGRISDVSPVTLDVVRWAELRIDVSNAGSEDDAAAAVQAAVRQAHHDAEGRLLAARMIIMGATAAHEALMRDPRATRDRLRAEVHAYTGGETWIEELRIATRPLQSPVAADLPEELRERILTGVPNSLDDIRSWLGGLLDRAGDVRRSLGDTHPATRLVVEGELDTELLEEARAMLVARLGL